MKYLRKLLICICCAGCLTAFGQSGEAPVYAHTLYRSNGSVLKGEITEWTPDYVTFRLLTGVTLRIDNEDIRKIVSRNIPKQVHGESGNLRPEYRLAEKGMYHVTTIAASGGPYGTLGATHAVGYRFSRVFGIAGGAGIESFDVGSGNGIVPVFAEARGYLMKRNISPYYAVRGGYGFATTSGETGVSETRGGALCSVELGYRFSASRSVNFFAGVGMHLQRAEYRYEFPWEWSTHDRITYRRTELRFGVMF